MRDMNRVIKYDILRIAACFFIVMLQVSGNYLTVVNIFSNDFLFMTVYNGQACFSVPIFFMSSGLFLVSPQKNMTAGNLIKRILKLLLCFYVWSALYAFQGVFISAVRGDFSGEVLEAALRQFIFGHSHMWLIRTLIGFYLLIPIARQICESEKVLQYYLLLWAVFSFFLPLSIKLFKLWIFSAWINRFARLDILDGYFGYFILGYYLNKVDIKKGLRCLIYASGIVACFLTIFLTILESRFAGVYAESWMSPDSATVLIMSVAVFVFFKYNCFQFSKRSFLWIKISNYTFFVYMFHMFVTEKLNMSGFSVIAFFPVISVPIITIFVFASGLLLAFVVDHIPFAKKIFMLH